MPFRVVPFPRMPAFSRAFASYTPDNQSGELAFAAVGGLMSYSG